MPEIRSEPPQLIVFSTSPASRKLGPALRRRFKKHTPPVTYIRLEDRRVR